MVIASRPPGRQGALAVRRLIAILAVTGCAQAGMPPGGPPDKVAPRLVRVYAGYERHQREGSLDFVPVRRSR
jgi:hypothetical protein